MLTKKYPTTIYLTDGRELIPYIEPWEEDMFDLENKLIRANKRAKKYREELKSARELWGETIHQKNIQINNIFLNAKKRNNKELVKVHKRLEIKSFLAHQYEFDSHMNEYIADQRLEGWEREEKLVTTWKYVALIFLAGFIYLILTV